VGRVGEAPQPHCPIVAAARENLPVRAESARLHRFSVRQGWAEGWEVSVRELPEPRATVGAAGRKVSPLPPNATQFTPSWWPMEGEPSGAGGRSSRSHKITVSSSPPVARIGEVGLNATVNTAPRWPRSTGPAVVGGVALGDVP
jgi:hypothetical protein